MEITWIIVALLVGLFILVHPTKGEVVLNTSQYTTIVSIPSYNANFSSSSYNSTVSIGQQDVLAIQTSSYYIFLTAFGGGQQAYGLTPTGGGGGSGGGGGGVPSTPTTETGGGIVGLTKIIPSPINFIDDQTIKVTIQNLGSNQLQYNILPDGNISSNLIIVPNSITVNGSSNGTLLIQSKSVFGKELRSRILFSSNRDDTYVNVTIKSTGSFKDTKHIYAKGNLAIDKDHVYLSTIVTTDTISIKNIGGDSIGIDVESDKSFSDRLKFEFDDVLDPNESTLLKITANSNSSFDGKIYISSDNTTIDVPIYYEHITEAPQIILGEKLVTGKFSEFSQTLWYLSFLQSVKIGSLEIPKFVLFFIGLVIIVLLAISNKVDIKWYYWIVLLILLFVIVMFIPGSNSTVEHEPKSIIEQAQMFIYNAYQKPLAFGNINIPKALFIFVIVIISVIVSYLAGWKAKWYYYILLFIFISLFFSFI